MKNTAFSAFQRACAGRYEKHKEINGRPSYKMDGKAIWYLSNLNVWIIGHIENIGNRVGCFYTKDNFGGLCDSKNVWNFTNNTKVNNFDIVVRPSK